MFFPPSSRSVAAPPGEARRSDTCFGRWRWTWWVCFHKTMGHGEVDCFTAPKWERKDKSCNNNMPCYIGNMYQIYQIVVICTNFECFCTWKWKRKIEQKRDFSGIRDFSRHTHARHKNASFFKTQILKAVNRKDIVHASPN